MQDEKAAYKNYLNDRKGADQYNEFKKILYGELDSLLEEIFKFIFPFVKKRKKLNILDIGGGDGKRLRRIMDLLNSKNIGVSATLVEPSKAFTDDAIKAQKKCDYRIKVERSTFEDFKTKEKFDLILMIHSFYAFGDFPVFKKIDSLMEKGAYLFIAGNDEDSFLGKLKAITKRGRQGSRNGMEYIILGLKRHKYLYQARRLTTIYNNFLKDGRLTKESELITSWIALKDWAKIQPDMRKEILGVFRAETKDSKIREKELFIIARK